MKKIRITALFLALLMLTSVFCSCGGSGGGKNSDTTTGATTTGADPKQTTAATGPITDEYKEFDRERVGQEDYSGITEDGVITFLALEEPTASLFSEYTEADGNPININDRIVSRNSFLTEKYGVTFKTEYSLMKQFGDALLKQNSSNDNMYQIATPGVTEAFTLALNGLICEINEIDDNSEMDLNAPWWNSNIIEETAVEGNNYFAIGDINLNAYNSLGCLFLNVNYLKELTELPELFELYAMVDESKWTFEYMADMCEKASFDTDGLGFNENDKYGITMNSYGALCFTYGFGDKFIERTDENELKLRITGEFYTHFTSLVEFCKDSTKVLYCDLPQYTENRVQLPSILFMDDRTLLTNGCLSYTMELTNYSGEYGLLPMPKYTETQENYASFIHQYLSSTICITGENRNNAKALGAILEDMCSYSHFNVRPVYTEELIKLRYFNNEETGLMLDLIVDSIVCDFAILHSATGGLSLITDLRKQLTALDEHISSLIGGNVSKYNGQIDAAVTKLSEYEG